jgi:hypothetical protein
MICKYFFFTASSSLRQGDQEAAQVLLDAGADAAATDSLGRAASDMIKVIPLHMISLGHSLACGFVMICAPFWSMN